MYEGSERHPFRGQRYWSEAAYQSFRSRYRATPVDQRHARDGGPALITIPKRTTDGDLGLVSEHVVPKKTMKRLLLERPDAVEELLRLNLCAVVTRPRIGGWCGMIILIRSTHG